MSALAAIEPETDQQALTVAEFAAMCGLKQTTAKERLRALVKTGRAKATKKVVLDVLGRRQVMGAYRLVQAKARR